MGRAAEFRPPRNEPPGASHEQFVFINKMLNKFVFINKLLNKSVLLTKCSINGHTSQNENSHWILTEFSRNSHGNLTEFSRNSNGILIELSIHSPCILNKNSLNACQILNKLSPLIWRERVENLLRIYWEFIENLLRIPWEFSENSMLCVRALVGSVGITATRGSGRAECMCACAFVCVCVCLCVCVCVCVFKVLSARVKTRWQFSGEPCDSKLPTSPETLEIDSQHDRFATSFRSDRNLQWTDRRGQVKSKCEFSVNAHRILNEFSIN
jgi:hypothetical protein